jgi:hypothetical protein
MLRSNCQPTWRSIRLLENDLVVPISSDRLLHFRAFGLLHIDAVDRRDYRVPPLMYNDIMYNGIIYRQSPVQTSRLCAFHCSISPVYLVGRTPGSLPSFPPLGMDSSPLVSSSASVSHLKVVQVR